LTGERQSETGATRAINSLAAAGDVSDGEFPVTSVRMPIIAVPLGDPAGIGAELVAKLAAAPGISEAASLIVVGDRWLWEDGQAVAGVQPGCREIRSFADVARGSQGGLFFLPLETVRRDEVKSGVADASGGRSVMQVLRHCLAAAARREIDGICYAPLNKLAMKRAGLKHEDELHFFRAELGVRQFCCEFNVLDRLWSARVTSHIPLRDVAAAITRERIGDCLRLVHDALVRAGCERPRIAVLALNPHAGEGGTCGMEEIETINPAIAQVAQAGIDAQGAFPADALFRRAVNGDFDAVVTMYHDQGQIALKLLGSEKGVTVHGGLPIVITTPAQGTAFDIVRQGRANPGAIVQAFRLCARMASRARLATA
jgi:4-hydroxythreonine-4-phosphate dehydrogenase